ncbi:MAG: spore coat U domain-containing protein [Pseudomonadota bacterium]|nr:spore coat U domain-containing protein [Pseudomonadota bacterium]
MKFNKTLVSVAVALFVGMPMLASADTATGEFNVTIKITATCAVDTGSGQAGKITSDTYTVGGADLDFGSHTSAETANVDATGSAGATGGIQVTCTKGHAYNIGLTPSNNNTAGAGSMAALQLGGITNTDTVAYQLYQDSARGQVWGDDVGTNTVLASGTGAAQKYPVYGRVPGGELNKMADRYADRVTVTVTY